MNTITNYFSYDISNFEYIFNEEKNKKNVEELKSLIKKSFEMTYYEFSSLKFYELLGKELKKFNKNDNDLILVYLKSNTRLKKYSKNTEFWKEYKNLISLSFYQRGAILSFIAFSFVQLKDYESAKNIYSDIKKIKVSYLECFIDCLIELGNFEDALKELKKYRPETGDAKIQKNMYYCEIFHRKNDIKNLTKYYKLSIESYSRFRYSKEIEIHSCYLYLLGKFSLTLQLTPNAILYFKNAINMETNGIVDNLYKEKAIKKLNDLGVKI